MAPGSGERNPVTAEDIQFCRDGINRCIEINRELRRMLAAYARDSHDMLQRWERDELHAQWREDNKSQTREMMNVEEPPR
jgi:hypothetical protein